MGTLNSTSLYAIEQFSSSIGLPARPARDGSFTFVFERSGTLSLTPSADSSRVLLSLARMPLRADNAIERRALQKAGIDPTTSRLVHAGLAADGSIVLAVGFGENELDLPALESCFQELVRAHDELG